MRAISAGAVSVTSASSLILKWLRDLEFAAGFLGVRGGMRRALVGQDGGGVFGWAFIFISGCGVLNSHADELAVASQVLPWSVVQRVGFVGARGDFPGAKAL